MGRRLRREPGGIGRLYRLLTEHGEAIEADLAQYYGVELADLFRGTLSLRRLRVLINGLPVDSRLVAVSPAEDGGPEPEAAARWSHIEYLLADLFDALVAINSRERPTPYPRPNHRRVVRRASPDRVARLRRLTGREAV